jgi:hypothetical protein
LIWQKSRYFGDVSNARRAGFVFGVPNYSMGFAESVGVQSIFRTTNQLKTKTCAVLGVDMADGSAFERHYRISDLAELWGLGRETIRKVVSNEPGVVKVRFGRKKSHTAYRIPASVVERVHTRLLNGG